jgi:hypothetical protein
MQNWLQSPRHSGRGRWPAPIDRKSTIELAALLICLATVTAFDFSSDTQLITPTPSIFSISSVCLGLLVAGRLGWLLSKVNRDWNSTLENILGCLLLFLLSGVIFLVAANRSYESVAFRTAGPTFYQQYRLTGYSAERRGREHWLHINPYHRFRSPMIPVSREQFEGVSTHCAARDHFCLERICLDFPTQRADNGAVRIMIDEDDPATTLRLHTCTVSWISGTQGDGRNGLTSAL